MARSVSPREQQQRLTEEALGENVRDAAKKLGWRFLWLRKTYNSSAGILDLTLIPLRDLGRRHTLHRELKGYDARGRLGQLTDEQRVTIDAMNAAGDDAALWVPEDWFSGRIDEELR